MLVFWFHAGTPLCVGCGVFFQYITFSWDRKQARSAAVKRDFCRLVRGKRAQKKQQPNSLLKWQQGRMNSEVLTFAIECSSVFIRKRGAVMRKNQKTQGAKVSAYARRVGQRCTAHKPRVWGRACPRGTKAGAVYTAIKEGRKVGCAVPQKTANPTQYTCIGSALVPFIQPICCALLTPAPSQAPW